MDAANASSSFPFLVGTSIAILLMLICSALFSRSETALTTANRGKLHTHAEDGAVTMAGLVIDFARRIHEQDETFTIEGQRIEILHRENTRLTKLHVRKASDG